MILTKQSPINPELFRGESTIENRSPKVLFFGVVNVFFD